MLARRASGVEMPDWGGVWRAFFSSPSQGMPSSFARMTSGLVSGMAEEVTTTSGETSSMVAAAWPMCTWMPDASRSRT